MCRVHGPFMPCRCEYARALGLVLLACAALGPISCAALAQVTPAQRAAGYEREAQAVSVACKAYRFDRATGLTPDVPAMAEICE